MMNVTGFCRMMMMMMAASFIFGHQLLRAKAADAYSSTAAMKHLYRSREAILDEVEKYIRSEVERINHIQSLYAESISAVQPHNEADMEHPVWAFHTLRQWAFLFDAIYARQDTTKGLGEVLRSKSEPAVSVGSDLIGSVIGLLRLQLTYKLPTQDMANGVIRGRQSHPLDRITRIRMAEAAIHDDNLPLGVEWLQSASSMAPSGGTNSDYDTSRRDKGDASGSDQPEEKQLDTSVEDKLLNEYFVIAYYKMNQTEKAVNVLNEALKQDPGDLNLLGLRKAFRERRNVSEVWGGQAPTLLQSKMMKTAEQRARNANIDPIYTALCRGEPMRVEPIRKSMQHCRYRRTAVPYDLIKEEVFSVSPWISVMYDVISEDEIETIKNISAPHLTRSAVHEELPTKDDLGRSRIGMRKLETEVRVSKTTWLKETAASAAFEVTEKLNQRLERITGMRAKPSGPIADAEPFQIVNYGLGGQYETHADYIKRNNTVGSAYDSLQLAGDRVATFLIYLSDVEEGGATVFPQLNISIPARKGTAAFWFNIKRNGDVDTLTHHAGCPVLVGDKWVTNKWFREHAQIFRRPCALTRSAIEDGYSGPHDPASPFYDDMLQRVAHLLK